MLLASCKGKTNNFGYGVVSFIRRNFQLRTIVVKNSVIRSTMNSYRSAVFLNFFYIAFVKTEYVLPNKVL